MSKSIRWITRSTLGIAAVTMLAACSPLPTATPDVIGLAGDRIELNAVAAHTALVNLIDNAEISRKQIKAARDTLEQIRENLPETDPNRSQVQQVLQLLDQADKGLQPSAGVVEARDQIKPRLASISSALKQVQTILAAKVKQEQIVNNLANMMQEAISNE